jgi:copper chaperone CopZ
MAQGMNIVGQAQKLRKKVNELDGILDIDINYILDTVSITYDSDRVTLPKIRKTIDTR